MVVWLIKRIVRDVSGAWSFEKNAAVRALATAPSMAKTIVAELIGIGTPASTRTPRIRPPRSTTAMMASFRAVAAAARSRNVCTSAAIMIGSAAKRIWEEAAIFCARPVGVAAFTAGLADFTFALIGDS